MSKLVLCLWYDRVAEEAMHFYVDTFNGAPNKTKESKILSIDRFPKMPEGGGGPSVDLSGKVAQGKFELAGYEIMAFDGGPEFKFNESSSLVIDCEDSAEVDYFWEELTGGGGQESMCGWVKDKYGMSWQIVPKLLGELMGDPDSKKVEAVMGAMMQMKKLDSAKLQETYDKAI